MISWFIYTSVFDCHEIKLDPVSFFIKAWLIKVFCLRFAVIPKNIKESSEVIWFNTELPGTDIEKFTLYYILVNLKIFFLLHPFVWIERIESLRFLRSSEVTLGQGLLRKGGGPRRGIYLSTSRLSIDVTKNRFIYIILFSEKVLLSLFIARQVSERVRIADP